MTHSTEIKDTPPPVATPKPEWVTPEIRRMSSGSAENGGRAANDGGIFTS